MARIRSVKPEFFRHEGLQDLEAAHPGSYVMLVFQGLWGHCDSQGVFEHRPRHLKLDILPFLPFDMAETLALLEAAGFVKVYESGGKRYGIIESFPTHQRLSGKESGEAGVKHPLPAKTDDLHTGKRQGSTGEAPGKHPVAQEKEEEREGKRKRSKEREGDTASQAAAGAARGEGRDEGPVVPEPVPEESEPLGPFQEVEAVLKGVAARLETPEPTSEEVRRWLSASSPLRRLIGKFGIPGTVELGCYAMTHSPGCTWGRVWEANASFASQMRKGCQSSYRNGKAQTLAESAQENLRLLQGGAS